MSDEETSMVDTVESEATEPKVEIMEKSKGKGTSAMWNYFQRDGNRAICLYCNKSISIRGGAYGNLPRHLRNKHPTVYEGDSKLPNHLRVKKPRITSPRAKQFKITKSAEGGHDVFGDVSEQEEAANTLVYEITYPEGTIHGENGGESTPAMPFLQKASSRKKRTLHTELNSSNDDANKTEGMAFAYGNYIGEMIKIFPVKKATLLINSLNDVVGKFVADNL